MADKVQIVAYEGTELKVLSPGDGSREAALSLPLSRLIVKVVRVPADQAEDATSVAARVLQSMSPYPDEPLTVSCEKLRETPDGVDVLAVALPESATDDIADALDAAKLSVTRVDATVLGQLRGMWSEIAPDGDAGARRMLVVGGPDCTSVFVLDGTVPCEVRAVSPESDISREALLSLLAAESFAGARALSEVVVAGDVPGADALAALAPVRRIGSVPDPAPGLAERAEDPLSANALPSSWREVLEETRFKAKLKGFLIVAGVVWALAMGILFGVPLAYGYMTDHQKALSREHARAYSEVKEMRDKVRLVQKYSDHSRSALEILKAVSDRLPAGVELTSWNFRRGESVRVSGEASETSPVYQFKDRLVDTGAFEGGVTLSPIRSQGGKQKFDIECKFVADEEGLR